MQDLEKLSSKIPDHGLNLKGIYIFLTKCLKRTIQNFIQWLINFIKDRGALLHPISHLQSTSCKTGIRIHTSIQTISGITKMKPFSSHTFLIGMKVFLEAARRNLNITLPSGIESPVHV